MRLLRRLRLGYGSKADSYPHEKPHSAGIEFYGPNGEIGYWQFNGTEWVVVVNGVQTGTIPGSGGGGGSAPFPRFTVGAVDGNGPILPTNVVYWAQVGKSWTLSGTWRLRVLPDPCSVTVDIRLTNFPTIPTSGDSITGGNAPVVSSGASATGNYTGWTGTSIAAGQMVAAVITANTGCRYIDLMLEAS